MKTTCEGYQMRLMDAFYGERALNAKENEHLEHCESCSQFWSALNQMDQTMTPLRMAANNEMNQMLPADIADIRKAFVKAEIQTSNTKSTYQFLAFLSLSIMIVMAMILPVLVGRVDIFLTLQGLLALIAFLSIPLLLRFSSGKGGKHSV